MLRQRVVGGCWTAATLLDAVCDEGYPGGSGMPACLDLCGGGFLSCDAHAGTSCVVARADIVRCGLARGRDEVKFEEQ